MGKSIMIQGTGSSVGKSLLTAGLLRVLYEDGYNVAPFKSQNMALNSFITKEGLEMGRAQAVQAFACKKEPNVLMNPILLKPSTDKMAQVILNGKVLGNYSAMEYHEMKLNLKVEISKAYTNISNNHDVIVIEGAGSPAEINLRENDLVNMGMASISDSPVLIVGDIDKGGVFAQLAGTLLLLTDEEKSRVKGVIINKFRGDLKILEPGLRMLEDIIKIPVVGVVPFFPLNIEDEDSLHSKFSEEFLLDNKKLQIRIIHHRHISNSTDFDPFDLFEKVQVRYVKNKEDLKEADLIIIPGTKATIGDLKNMYDNGIALEIQRLSEIGIPVIGICGGLQMMGNTIEDPEFIESNLEKIDGLGLLDIKTIFKGEKRTVQIQGKIENDLGIFSGTENIELQGYEIHMGESIYNEKSFVTIDNGTKVGVISKEGNLMGTYMHGIFDNLEFTKIFIDNILLKKGIENTSTIINNYDFIKEQEFTKLGNLIREHLDVEFIKKIIGL
jgi:adenosylcobyric acid synthase